MYEKNQGKGEASMEGHQYSVDTLGSPLAGCSAPQASRSLVGLRDRNASSPLSSLALRTSSDTRRTELRRAARSPLGTSKRTKYSRWGLPASGFWAGRVSKWWILASNVFGSKSRKREKERDRQGGSNGDRWEERVERNEERWKEAEISGEQEDGEGAAERLRETDGGAMERGGVEMERGRERWGGMERQNKGKEGDGGGRPGQFFCPRL